MAIKQIKSFLSPRVKSLNAHPTQPLLLAALYTGDIQIWNTNNMSLKKTISVSKKPCRTAIFYDLMGYIIAGDDEGCIAVMDMAGNVVSRFVAHNDFIRRIVISSNVLVSCSDDCMLKSWCLRTFKLLNVFESHTHFVMDVTPELVSASLDTTVKFWDLSGKLRKTINAHKNGINCVTFISTDVFVTGSDDPSIKAWDPSLITTINPHTKNINRIVKLNKEFASCSEDGYVKFWNFNFALERSVNLQSRVWDIAQKSGKLFVATDEALVVLEDKSEQILACMSNDKVFYTVGSTLYYHRIASEKKAAGTAFQNKFSASSGEGAARLAENTQEVHKSPMSTVKEVQLDYFPDSLSCSPSGKLVSLTCNSSFMVYSVLGFRSRLTGSAVGVVFVGDQEYIARGDGLSFYKKGEVVGRLGLGISEFFLVGSCGVDFEKIDFDVLNMNLKNEICGTGPGPENSCEGNAEHTERLCVLTGNLNDEALLFMTLRTAESASLTIAMDFYGNVHLRTSLVLKFVFKVKHNLVFCTDKKLMIVEKGVVSFVGDQIVDGGVVDEDVLYFRSGGKLHYLLIPGTVSDTKMTKDPIFYPFGYFPGRIVGVRGDHLFYCDDKKIKTLGIDKEFVHWQLCTIDGMEVPITNVTKSIKFLQLIGEYERALGLSSDDNLKFEILLNLGRLEEALKLANNRLKYQKLAKEFLKRKMYDKAAECFHLVGDAYNCYLVDFKKRFKFNMNDSNLGFFMALEEKNYRACADILKTTMFCNLFRKNYIK